jgi:hypothetical protein
VSVDLTPTITNGGLSIVDGLNELSVAGLNNAAQIAANVGINPDDTNPFGGSLPVLLSPDPPLQRSGAPVGWSPQAHGPLKAPGPLSAVVAAAGLSIVNHKFSPNRARPPFPVRPLALPPKGLPQG